jgi:eukaryotic-like serine/threonine-protein kinase
MAQTTAAGGQYEPSAAGSGVPDSPELWGIGGTVGDRRYRLTRRLGRGGMAEVFAAEDVRLGRTVAVKLLRSDLAEDPVSKARFTREAQSVAGLNHHAIVAVYDSGEDQVPGGAIPYMVMEIVEGRTIRELLNESAEPPPVEQAMMIVAGVLDALAYSHQHGIVHRDIKPANVIITDSGAVKVMDFGIARALHGAAQTMTQTGMVMGTPQYLSPEQALGKTVDTRSDLYATGCLLFELLALRPPFVGETPLSVVYQHVQDAPQLPSEISDRVPPELNGLVMRSLAKDPDDRFQSAEEMRGVIQYALNMLYQHGGWTGTWNTGPIASTTGGATAVMGMPPRQTGGYGPPGAGFGTAQFPAAAADPTIGYRPHSGGGHGGRGGRPWIKPVLFVIAAVIAVSLGVWLAVSNTDDKPRRPAVESPTAAPPTGEPSAQPTDTPTAPTDEETGEPTAPGYNPSPFESDTPRYEQNYSPPKQPSEPTPSAPTSAEPSATPSAPSSSTGSGGTTGDDGTGDTSGSKTGSTSGDETGSTTADGGLTP